TCDTTGAQQNCQFLRNTIGQGIGLAVGGAAMVGLGFYLWGKEGGAPAKGLSILPSADGFSASFYGQF
ncbi:MAG: hypothetical protein JKY56_23695, partial [Kofleriaceae bacterium]|nr:hypothetical protein [Kofleriaceae bacterium]